jgi:DNA-binding LytR/AlgR family response regulator
LFYCLPFGSFLVLRRETKIMNHSVSVLGAAAQCIALPTCKGLLLIYRNQIIRIQSISNYSRLFLVNGKTVVASKVLRWFEDNPELKGFLRIHRTHLVNPDYIEGCGIRSAGFLFLSNGEKLKIARRKKAAIVKRLVHQEGGVIRQKPSSPFHPEQLKHRVA